MEQGMTASNAVGDGSMGVVQGATSPNYPTNTVQLITLDTTGAQKSSNEGMKATYSASTSLYAPYATAQDVFGVIGSAGKKIRVVRIAMSGRATSAAQLDAVLVKRSALNTGGSPSTVPAVPHDSNDPAASGSCVTYAALPSPAGVMVGQVRCIQSNVSQAGAGGAASPFEFDFAWLNDKAFVLNNANEGLYLNLLGQAIPGGTVLNIFTEWTEE